MIDGTLMKCLKNNIDVSGLCSRVELEPELWLENTWRQDYVVKLERPVSPQRDTEAVMFRWAPQNAIESVRDSVDVVEHENFKKIIELKPLLDECLEACGSAECGRVFIAKLKPGGHVIPHCDFGLYSEHFERFHLVLTSSPGNEFYVQDSHGLRESAYMKPGEFFWFNHKAIHWAFNRSGEPRMHLIIDAVAPKYRRDRVAIPA